MKKKKDDPRKAACRRQGAAGRAERMGRQPSCAETAAVDRSAGSAVREDAGWSVPGREGCYWVGPHEAGWRKVTLGRGGGHRQLPQPCGDMLQLSWSRSAPPRAFGDAAAKKLLLLWQPEDKAIVGTRSVPGPVVAAGLDGAGAQGPAWRCTGVCTDVCECTNIGGSEEKTQHPQPLLRVPAWASSGVNLVPHLPAHPRRGRALIHPVAPCPARQEGATSPARHKGRVAFFIFF